MTTALRAMIRRVMANHHLDPNKFAEEVLFTPEDGAERVITVHVEENKQELDASNVRRTDMEEIVILAFRDVDTTIDGRVIGGINTANNGDKIQLQRLEGTSGFRDSKPYFYQRSIPDKSPDKVRLVYARRTVEAHGVRT